MNVYVIISDGVVVEETMDFNKAHRVYESYCYSYDIPTIELREYTYETAEDYLLGDDPVDSKILYIRTGSFGEEEEEYDGTDDI